MTKNKDRTSASPMNPATAFRVALVGVLLMFGMPASAIAACGGDGGAPCKLWERIPSCDKNLVEDFKVNRCVKPEKHSAYKVCGGSGQRPCNVWEAFPSCHPGLVEDFGANKCVPPNKQCGSLNGTPCLFTERFPSCNSGLVEDFLKHKCVEPAGARQICEGVVNAIRQGVIPPGFRSTLGYLTQHKKDLQGGIGSRPVPTAKDGIQPYSDEVKRIAAILGDPKNKPLVDELFSASTLCGDVGALPARLVKLNLMADPAVRAQAKSASAGQGPAGATKLVQGAGSAAGGSDTVPPIADWPIVKSFERPGGAVFMSISVSAAVTPGIGGITGGFTLVWDALGKNPPAVFFSGGPAGALNVSAGVQYQPMIYPSMRYTDFPGWFVEFAISGGEVVSGGNAASFTVTPKFQFAGIGYNVGIGAGLAPVNVGGSGTYSWILNRASAGSAWQ